MNKNIYNHCVGVPPSRSVRSEAMPNLAIG